VLTLLKAKWHSRHHRLYVPYAYGALYNHPVEGFVLDTAGAGLAYKVAMMSPRLGMWFFVCCTMKTVDDHCGYAFPWDPLQHLTSNNAAYHDIHHQSWGIKTNFSQPFFTIWDRILGTMWKGDTALMYERARARADQQAKKKNGVNGKAGDAAASENVKST
jgi:sphinganine C4-monooxygenase